MCVEILEKCVKICIMMKTMALVIITRVKRMKMVKNIILFWMIKLHTL